MKKYLYLPIAAALIAAVVLLGVRYNFITDTATKVILLVVAGGCLSAYYIIKIINRRK